MEVLSKILKILKILDGKSIFLFLIVFTITSFLETLGVGLVIPIIALVLEPNFIVLLSNSKFSYLFPNFIFNFNNNEALLFFSVALITIFVIKNILILLSVYFINNFVGVINANLTKKLMHNYLHQNYLFHTNKNISEINRNINQKVMDVAHGCVASLLFILSEIMIILFLLILIIFIDLGNIFAILSIFILVGLILVKLTNKFIKKIGILRAEQINQKFENFSNIINNFREIILLGKINHAFKDFYSSLFMEAKFSAQLNVFKRFPALVFEIIAIISLISIIFFLRYEDYNTVKIIGICSFFAAVVFRALPSLNKIIFYYFQIKFNTPSLEAIEKELSLKSEVQYHDEKINFKKELELNNIYFRYNNESDYIFENLNLSISKGEIIGIFGKSGIGKTTLLDLISSLVKPNKGELKIDGISINTANISRKLQNITSYSSQKTTVINATIKENICFGLEKNFNEEKLNEVIDFSDLNEFGSIDQSKISISDAGKNISGGQLQRIGLARALYLDREILILDEATSALDLVTEKKIFDKLSKLKGIKTIIIVTHRVSNLEICDKIYELKNKKLILKK